ncbi:MAG TPA: hypothetical protein VM711_06815, partial [Sphingomicrobium sp.]|nr:hypothetical protein [Sphingomicrobium sp.]
PVFMLQRGYLDRKQCAYTLGERFYFLGVLYCGPVIKNDGHIVLTQQPRVAVDAMMHLGQVIRSTALLGLDAELMKIAGLPVGSEAALAALQAGPTDRAYTA